ncbi:MAG: glycosyltransferase family 4 protein [Saprospiraceae bacterium]
MESGKKLFIVVNVDWFFLSHRLPIALEALKRGYDVTVLAIEEEGRGEEIRNHGLKFIPLPSSRGGTNIWNEWKLIRFLYKIYKNKKPDIIHHVAIKPVLYGSLAAKYLKIPKVVNAISGLGSMFINPSKVSLIYRLIKFLYKFSFNNPNLVVIVQNEDDGNIIEKLSKIKPANIFLIKGSGVDMSKYIFSEEIDALPIQIVLVSRMLWDKGVGELVESARALKKKYGKKINFVLAGKIDLENKSAISKSQLVTWNKEGLVEWIGFQTNVAQLYTDSHIAVLPSYREGLPKSLIEAMAIGRPVITTDVPGCREVVESGHNGYLVKAQDSVSLTAAMDKLITNKELRIEMGKNGRKKAEQEFSLQMVLEKTFDIYADV